MSVIHGYKIYNHIELGPERSIIHQENNIKAF